MFVFVHRNKVKNELKNKKIKKFALTKFKYKVLYIYIVQKLFLLTNLYLVNFVIEGIGETMYFSYHFLGLRVRRKFDVHFKTNRIKFRKKQNETLNRKSVPTIT